MEAAGERRIRRPRKKWIKGVRGLYGDDEWEKTAGIGKTVKYCCVGQGPQSVLLINGV